MFLTAAHKGIVYQLSYWVTALLPVILGFGITMLLVWYFTKHYNGPEDLEDFNNYEEEEFEEDDN